MFGSNPELGYKTKSIIPWISFISFSIVLVIVMLNLLIAIISDEFDKVQTNYKSTDLKAKCAIIKEFGEIIQFIKGRLLCQTIEAGELMFVHRFSEAIAVEDGDANVEWVGRIKMINQKHEQILEGVREMKQKLTTYENKLDRIDKME